MDIIYYGLLLVSCAVAFIGSTAVLTGLKAVIDGDIFGIAVVASGIIWLGVAVYHGIQAGRRRQSRE